MSAPSGRSPAPKDFIAKQGQFGRREPAAWIATPEDAAERYRMMEAYFQHRVAYAVREAIETSPNTTYRSVAESLGISPRTLDLKLRGVRNARIWEILALVAVVGVDVYPPIDERNDLLPEEDWETRLGET